MIINELVFVSKILRVNNVCQTPQDIIVKLNILTTQTSSEHNI